MSTVVSAHLPRQTPRPPAEPERLSYLGLYLNPATKQKRHIVRWTLPDQSVLVLDTDSGAVQGARLIAHLTADEPSENAELVSQMYLADENKGRCRAVTRDDLRGAEELEAWGCASAPTEASILDRHGRIYRISELRGLRPAAELRWICSPASDGAGPCELVRLRVVVGAMESYEPARSMTYAALANVSGRGNVATDRLRWELQRLVCSHLVLNRGLREAVVRAVARGELSLSEIASRCGRGKSGKGQFGGDTSWLERRIGMRSEGGEATPRPWTHADVLALIARDGLGLSPNEVEV